MRRLSSLAWRSLVSRRLRSLLTVAGIALGVAVVFATQATNVAIEQSVDSTVAGVMGRAQLRVGAFAEIGLDAASLVAIGSTPGITVVAPEIERRSYLLPASGAPALGPRGPVTVLGIDPAADPVVHPRAMATGVPLAAGSPGALISARLAQDDGLAVGDSITIGGVAGPDQSTLPIVGILAPAAGSAGPGARLVIIPVESAGVIFGMDGVTRADLMVAAGSMPEAVAAELERRITTRPYTIVTPADVAASLRASTADFQSMTALIAAVALFVGAFLIFNTLSMTVAERVREVGLLRAAGTTRSQVHRFVLLQAMILGLLGSVAGTGLGYLLALWMGGLLAGQSGTVGNVAIQGVAVPFDGVLLSIGVGLAVTLASALEPAWRAGRISPVDALRRRPDISPTSGARLRWLVAVFAVVGATGLLFWPRGSVNASLVRSYAVYAVLLIATLASPIIIPPLSRLAGIPFRLLFRAEERLARGGIVRDPSRTALTVGSLAIGLAMIVAVGAILERDHRAADAWLADVVPGEEIATAIRPTGLDEGVQEDLAAVVGVAHVSPMARFQVSFGGVRLDAAALSGADMLADGRLTFLAGDRRTALASLDEADVAVLPAALADRLGLRLGDRMTFVTASGGAAQLRVAGIAERTLPGSAGESILVGWDNAVRLFGVSGADAFAVRFAPDQVTAARPALEAAARGLGLEATPLGAIEGAVRDSLHRVFGLFDALAAIAVIVAGLGILNTLTMNVWERVREIGILRAVGMTRRQVGRMVMVEAGVMGLLGVVLGCFLGLTVGAMMTFLAGGSGPISPADIPWQTLGLASLFGLAVTFVASYYPARLASGVPIVRALQFE